MADTKITALTALTAADPANDVLPIVDVSDTTMAASGTTKKISVNNILGASGTATLASATITGDLTVDTSTLKVDSANNRVTVGTLSAYGRLTVGVGSGSQAGTTTNVAAGLVDIDYATTGDINTRLSFVNSNGATNAAIDRIGNPNFNDNGNLAFLTRAGAGSLTERYRIAADGVATWSNVGGVAGTAMTLNSTGLGVGVASPSAKLHISGNLKIDGATSEILMATGAERTISASGSSGATALTFKRWDGVSAYVSDVVMDASGTLLVGTTSAGASGFRCYLSTDSGTTKWSVGPYVSATNFAIVASGSAGGVYLNGTTATSWTALSDERFKDIIEPISNAVAKVGSLRAVIGKIKGDETNTRKSFLIAQDVESVLPEAVDASNPDRLGLAYTDVIPLLVAAIKELTARVQTLETR